MGEVRSAVVAARSGELPWARIAFAVWSTAFAVGVLLHEWQRGAPPWSIHSACALAAIAVLLRPVSVLRLGVLLALLAVELAVWLPNPWNHSVVVGVVGGAIVLWWALQLRRSSTQAFEASFVYERVAPFLRVGFIVVWYITAFAKLNEGFLDERITCAGWIIEQIPILEVPSGLNPLLIASTYFVEFAIPTLLIFPRTRPLGILIGFGFHFIAAVGGHTAFSGFAWSFYLLFLPTGTLARVAATARAPLSPALRRRIAGLARNPATYIALAMIWLFAMGMMELAEQLPGEWEPRFRRWGAALPYLVYAAVWAGLLTRHWRRFLFPPAEPGFGLRVREPIFLVALALIVLNSTSPYLGLKTRYSLTMYSNLQTEPGEWNHVVLPESVRIFDFQEGRVRFLETDDPSFARAIEKHGTSADTELTFEAGSSSATTSFVLKDARLLALDHRDATVDYELDGAVRRAAPVASDPVLGDRPGFALQTLGGFRPINDACQH